MKIKTIMNSSMKIGAITVMLLLPTMTFAANTLTTGATITKIDATTYNGNIKVQTSPRPNIATTACTSDFWLILRADSANYKPLLASLLTAKAAGFTVSVGADDTNFATTGPWCEFSRLIVE